MKELYHQKVLDLCDELSLDEDKLDEYVICPDEECHVRKTSWGCTHSKHHEIKGNCKGIFGCPGCISLESFLWTKAETLVNEELNDKAENLAEDEGLKSAIDAYKHKEV